MDDLLLHSSKHGYFKYIEDLLKVLFKDIFKTSSKKYQLFGAEIQYRGNTSSDKMH